MTAKFRTEGRLDATNSETLQKINAEEIWTLPFKSSGSRRNGFNFLRKALAMKIT